MASKKQNIVYVTRDIERAMGRVPGDNYHIITNSSPYSLELKKQYPYHVLLIDSPKILDTYEILLHPETQKIIEDFKTEIIVFKNNANIEALCKEKNWKLLNPNAKLSDEIENKITQIKWLGDDKSLLPSHKIVFVKDIEWDKKALILQWSHGHTGDGTILIKDKKELDVLKEKFPHREARITEYIRGPMFTVNIIIGKNNILIGNISYQITGILPFTENQFSTIGNDWSLPHTILTEKQLHNFQKIAETVADKMKKSGWYGLFGIDVIYDEEKDKLYLIEINARQPASTTFESELQNSMRSHGVRGISTFDAHLNTLLNIPFSQELIQINDGAQILQRITTSTKKIDSKRLIDAGYKVIEYKNEKNNADLARIQSNLGIMEAHNKFNKRGKEILELLG